MNLSGASNMKQGRYKYRPADAEHRTSIGSPPMPASKKSPSETPFSAAC
jgi:hypothetical protein